MRVKRETVAALILVLATGCGAGDDAEVSTLATVRPCLARLGKTNPVCGGIATGASEAVRLRLPSSAVTVLFGANADAASDLATDYGVARGDRTQLGNVVLAWEAVPNAHDVLAVERCITATETAAVTRRTVDSALPLKLVVNVPLPGPSNRFDYTSLDPTMRRLWIAHMDAGQLLVFDVDRRRVVKVIAAPGVHGVIAVPQIHRVYASATDARQLFTIDNRTGRVLNRAPAGEYPDGLVYDPAERKVFVSDESGGVEAVFNAAGGRSATVQLGGEAGNVQYDRGSGRVLADVQSRDQVAVIDPRSNRVVRRVALSGCDHPHGLNVDAPHRLAFVACDGNAKLLTLDLKTMKVVGSMEIGSSPDVLAFDTSLKRLYVASESGVLTVAAERRRRLVKLGQGMLAPSAHTVAVDPTTHFVYFPLERGHGEGPELRIMKPTVP
jgi:DNA-binding beta-propeller fold protein YncE